MPAKKKTAQELVRRHPGASDRRRALILALSTGAMGAAGQRFNTGECLAAFILAAANHIIEQTEQ